jgi:hypothetical protein
LVAATPESPEMAAPVEAEPSAVTNAQDPTARLPPAIDPAPTLIAELNPELNWSTLARACVPNPMTRNQKKTQTKRYNIQLIVEFDRGVNTQIPAFFSDSREWASFVTRGTAIKIGPEHFTYDERIADLTVGRYQPGHLRLEQVCAIPRSSAKTVVVVIESPHRHETEEPLSNPKSRGNFLKNIGLLCNYWLEEPADVVLCNPIQWKTSLAWCYDHVDMLEQVRYGVWTNIWNYSTRDEKKGVRFPAREDFEKRLKSYNPVLVVNACTTDLHDDVGDSLKEIVKVQVVNCNHPSGWNLLRETP